MSKRKGIIYAATNTVNGKMYIGKTVNGLEGRSKQHYFNAHNKNHSAYNTKFYKAIRKHKLDIFWSVIKKDINEEDIDKYEAHYINKYNTYKNGYNSTMGGEGCTGLVHSKEAKQKMSKSASERNRGSKNPRFGKPVSKETRLKISKANKGNILTPEQKKKQSESLKGRVVAEETRNKISKSKNGRVILVFKNKHFVGEWLNQRKCARDLGIPRSCIQKCLKNKTLYKRCYGFKYKEE